MTLMTNFPIMRRYILGSLRDRCPRTIPWYLIAPYNHQAFTNHGQNLRTLARRGGLGPSEAVAILEGRKWHEMEDEDAINDLVRIVQERS